jgi:[ribosomal protein S5]-alanine N-acetyltransferase
MISTSRLLVRKFRESDAPALFAYLSDPGTYRYEPGQPISLEEARELARQRAQGAGFWAVALKSTDQLVGHLYFSQNEPQELLTWELGYIFNPVYQGQGYATEASIALIRYGFEHWGIHRVVAHCNPQNIASWRVMEKIGMRREGVFRKNIFFNRDAGGNPIWLDTYEYAILGEDLLGKTTS